MFKFVNKTSRMRVDMRNKSEDLSEQFDWNILYAEYLESYEKALAEVPFTN